MSEDLAALIARAIEAKKGNKEFALFFLYIGDWRAEIGNGSQDVLLGEVEGEFRGEGKTPEEAVSELLAAIARG